MNHNSPPNWKKKEAKKQHAIPNTEKKQQTNRTTNRRIRITNFE